MKIHCLMFVKHSVTLMMRTAGKARSELLIPSAEQSVAGTQQTTLRATPPEAPRR